MDGVGKGSFSMNRNSVVTSLSQADMPGKKSPFGFKLTTGADDLYMFASSEEERKEWVEAIAGALANAPIVANSATNAIINSTTSENRLETLKRKIEEQKSLKIERREYRLQVALKKAETARIEEMNACAAEDAETVGLSKLYAECKIDEDTTRYNEVKVNEKALAEMKLQLDATPNPAMHARYDAESSTYKSDWQRLSQRAVQIAAEHAAAERAYKFAKLRSEAAREAADEAEEKAKKLRATVNDLAIKEAACKSDYEMTALLVAAPWTSEFQEEMKNTTSVSKFDKRENFTSITSTRNLNLIDLESRRMVEKKLGTENNFYDRYIWINEDTGCFHWAKSKKVGSPSKMIHIKTVAKTIKLCRPPNGSTWIGFSIEFNDDLDSAAFAGARGVRSKDECIDVKVSGKDAVKYVEALCRRVLEYIK